MAPPAPPARMDAIVVRSTSPLALSGLWHLLQFDSKSGRMCFWKVTFSWARAERASNAARHEMRNAERGMRSALTRRGRETGEGETITRSSVVEDEFLGVEQGPESVLEEHQLVPGRVGLGEHRLLL